MILLEVDATGVAVLVLECNAPGPVDVDRIARRLKTSQRMEIEARKIHLFRPSNHIQTIKAAQDAHLHLDVDLPGSTSLPKLGEALALEASNHSAQNVSY